MDRRKELKKQYQQSRPDMGVFVFHCMENKKNYVGCAHDLKGAVNSIRFRLNGGMFPGKPIQEDWNRYGERRFEIKTLETLSYSQDESKTDYTDDLTLLKELWMEKLENAVDAPVFKIPGRK